MAVMMDVTIPGPSDDLSAMKERLRALASRLTMRQLTSRATPSDDPSIQLLIEADDLLQRARDLAASLANSRVSSAASGSSPAVAAAEASSNR